MFTLMFILLGMWLWKKDEVVAIVIWFISFAGLLADYMIIKEIINCYK